MKSKEKHGHAWYRLIAGFYSTYESIPTGGNNTISQHKGRILQRLKNYTHHITFKEIEAEQKPVCKYLTKTLKDGMEEWYLPILPAIGHLRKNLKWEYGYSHLPGNLGEKFAYTEILGPNGPFVCEELTLGLVILGPSTEYPRHKHPGIEESYICLSGNVALDDTGVFSTNSIIYMPPGKVHRLSTEIDVPCLLAYAWIADPKTLKNAKLIWDT